MTLFNAVETSSSEVQNRICRGSIRLPNRLFWFVADAPFFGIIDILNGGPDTGRWQDLATPLGSDRQEDQGLSGYPRKKSVKGGLKSCG